MKATEVAFINRIFILVIQMPLNLIVHDKHLICCANSKLSHRFL